MAQQRKGRKVKRRAAWLAAAVAMTFTTPAAAQLLPLGGGGAPSLPIGGVLQSLPSTLGRVTQGVENTVDGPLRSTTSIVRDAVGRPRNLATATEMVDGMRIVRSEVIAVAPMRADLATARTLGFTVLRQEAFPALGLSATVLRAPGGMNTADALAALRRADPQGQYDYNNIYDPSGGDAAPSSNARSASSAAGVAAIGMIDAGVDRDHPALRDIDIDSACFAGRGAGPVTAHGTAVASLLVGRDGGFHGALRGARLYAADVYGGRASGGSAESIVRALAWMAQKRVAVVNISLSGPPNALLGAATEAFVKRGHVLVAAVGNDGPAAPERYPAAYPGVVGVTSVDSARDIQLDANRGGDVAFAARGVQVRAAALSGGYADVTGTSFAAPVVAARFAVLVPQPDRGAVARAWTTLEHDAVDLGAPGRDPVFGYGLLAAPRQTAAARDANARD